MKKQEFTRHTPVNNKEQIFCICRKTYNIGKEASAMVGCDYVMNGVTITA